MLSNLSRTQWAGAWLAAVVVMFVCSVVLGAATTVGASALWLFACVAPPAIMLLVWRGAPPPTVAEVLYAVDNPAKDSRK